MSIQKQRLRSITVDFLGSRNSFRFSMLDRAVYCHLLTLFKTVPTTTSKLATGLGNHLVRREEDPQSLQASYLLVQSTAHRLVSNHRCCPLLFFVNSIKWFYLVWFVFHAFNMFESVPLCKQWCACIRGSFCAVLFSEGRCSHQRLSPGRQLWAGFLKSCSLVGWSMASLAFLRMLSTYIFVIDKERPWSYLAFFFQVSFATGFGRRVL